MMKRQTGEYKTLGNVTYFIPFSLPPHNPEFEMRDEIAQLYGTAMQQLGKLEEASQQLPDISRFVRAYVIKEALLSSEIEGIHTTLFDVLTQPLEGIKITKETQLVLNYTHALESALDLQKKNNLPITSRVILHSHNILMSLGGQDAHPGHYRQQAVRVGPLVPPPASEIARLMTELESYINANSALPVLIRTGLTHVQFETIHPFLDGNGRIGRLLIVLMLIEDGLLSLPLIYPSLYFKKNQREYYQKLDRVRTEGDFEGWIIFFLKAIEVCSLDAYRRIMRIKELENNILKIFQSDSKLNSMRISAETCITSFFRTPIMRISELAQTWEKSYNTVAEVVTRCTELNILEELTAQRRNRLFCLRPYLTILESDLAE